MSCSTPDQYFYFDSAHPSDAAHRIVGAQLYAEALAIPEPMPIALLGLGIAGIAVTRRRRKV